jgi:sarcosine oxidase subunit alpha
LAPADRHLDPSSGTLIPLDFEGRPVAARAGESVAVALFASGLHVLSRSVKYHRPRGFFCLEGHCGGCLLRIGGRPNTLACRTAVQPKLRIERQNAFPSGGFDVLSAADYFFPRGMDHHTLMTSSRPLNSVMQKIVRQLAGLGRLPDAPEGGEAARPPHPPARVCHVDVAVIGGGPAGLACATFLAARGRTVMLVDEQDRVGGSYLAYPAHGIPAADAARSDALAAGVALEEGAIALAWYPEDAPTKSSSPGVLAVHARSGLIKLSAARYVYATGAYDQNALFVDNDRPGVCSARAAGRLLVRYRVRPGERPVVLGDGPYALELTSALAESGAEVTRLDGTRIKAVAAHGRGWVRALEVEESGRRRKIQCDLVAVAALPSPASELAREHGCEVRFVPEAGGFPCITDEAGATRRPEVFACGDVAGFVGPERAREAGLRVGEAVGRSLAAMHRG